MTARMEHLETLFQRYADVPREVVVKEDVLREGLAFSRAALAHDPRRETYQLFSWDQSRPEEMEDQSAAVSLPLRWGSLTPGWAARRISVFHGGVGRKVSSSRSTPP